jgi:hypothetical protein
VAGPHNDARSIKSRLRRMGRRVAGEPHPRCYCLPSPASLRLSHRPGRTDDRLIATQSPPRSAPLLSLRDRRGRSISKAPAIAVRQPGCHNSCLLTCRQRVPFAGVKDALRQATINTSHALAGIGTSARPRKGDPEEHEKPVLQKSSKSSIPRLCSRRLTGPLKPAPQRRSSLAAPFRGPLSMPGPACERPLRSGALSRHRFAPGASNNVGRDECPPEDGCSASKPPYRFPPTRPRHLTWH